MKPSEIIKARAEEIDKKMGFVESFVAFTDYDETKQKALIMAILEYLDSLTRKR